MNVSVRDERGMVGKLLVVWLLLLVVVAVAAIDAVSIGFARFSLADAAASAAADGAGVLNRGGTASEACRAASERLDAEAPDARRPRTWCDADARVRSITITLRTTAGTILAHRWSATERYVEVRVEETAGRSAL